MRTVLIAVALAGISLTACSLYLAEHPTQIGGPDAAPSSDGGHYDPDASGNDAARHPDAGLDAPPGGGCDAGMGTPDAPCCQQWPDAAVLPDAYGP
jgi:hypothetical protein